MHIWKVFNLGLQTDPSWNMYWALPYKELIMEKTWMIAGHQTKTTADGVETSVQRMIDIQFTDGLL